MHANLASIDTPAGPVTIIRPFVPEVECPAVKFDAGVADLVAREAVVRLRSLGALNGMALWEAEWVTCPLDVAHSTIRGNHRLSW